jgi:hypothetical protein
VHVDELDMTEKISLAELDSEDATILVSADGGRAGPETGPMDPEAPAATIEVPEDATEEELDAIATAVRKHLETHSATDAGASDDEPRWALAGRLRRAGVRTPRSLGDAPSDPWTAAGRATR